MKFAMIHGKSILSVSNERFLLSLSCLNLTLPWFAFIIQNTDIIFWVVDVVRDLLLTSDINGILLNHM